MVGMKDNDLRVVVAQTEPILDIDMQGPCVPGIINVIPIRIYISKS